MNFFIPLPVRVPRFIKWWYPSWYIWDKKTSRKTIYLTFDDGPIPEVTEWVLSTLLRKRIPATFFCIGDNVRKHPVIFERLITEGHSIGNHTFNHLKGWQTEDETYLKNTHLADIEMRKHTDVAPNELATTLFRPPYGKIKRAQSRVLRKLGYNIIMYRVVAYDWDATVTQEQCLKNVIKNTRDGDIIVFHDSVKAFENMKYALPKVIDYFSEREFLFGRL